MEELPVPEDMPKDSEPEEILRAFMAGDELHMTLNTSVFEDPIAWGVILAEFARQVSEAYSESGEADQSEILQSVATVFINELQSDPDADDDDVDDDDDEETDTKID